MHVDVACSKGRGGGEQGAVLRDESMPSYKGPRVRDGAGVEGARERKPIFVISSRGSLNGLKISQPARMDKK